jgi:hypothetical protein
VNSAHARAGAVAAAVLAILVISGCAAEAQPAPAQPVETVKPSETPTATAEPAEEEPLEFTQPRACLELLPPSRLDVFADDRLDLLGGPGGVYGTSYFSDATPEESEGGISCVWGSESLQTRQIVISVAPVSPANRLRITDEFAAQGLNEERGEDTMVYGRQGDLEIAPSVLNVLRDDSWISVLTSPGGQQSYAEAQAIVAEVAASVYR